MQTKSQHSGWFPTHPTAPTVSASQKVLASQTLTVVLITPALLSSRMEGSASPSLNSLVLYPSLSVSGW